MRLKGIQDIYIKELDGLYIKEEIDSFFYLLIERYFKISRIQLALNPDIEVANSEEILNALELLKSQKPIQYILGETEFYGLIFKVNGHVLIPRPETEELVDWLVKEADSEKALDILDIGTGSGCIAIALAKKLPNANVYALDVSKEALGVATENANLNGVEVTFIEKDILSVSHDELVSASQKFNIIVSNPPYVRVLEKEMMKPNVLDHEPPLALFVDDDDALKFYRAIGEFAKKKLKSNGRLFFEINEYLGEKTVALLKKFNFKNIELRQDMFGKDRMLKAGN